MKLYILAVAVTTTVWWVVQPPTKWQAYGYDVTGWGGVWRYDTYDTEAKCKAAEVLPDTPMGENVECYRIWRL